jgi:hypothetical protein
MSIRKSAARRQRAWPMISVSLLMLVTSVVFAQGPATQPLAIQPIPALTNSVGPLPVGNAEHPTVSSRHVPIDGQTPATAQPHEHPLMPVLGWAKQGLPAIESLKDYSAVLVRRERIRGKLTGYEYVFVKIRHQPFSVYACFQSPVSVHGQEVIYVAGQNQGNLLAHKARMRATVSLLPEGMIAMSGRRYPITEIGLVNLVRRLVEVGERDVNYGECEVKYFSKAAVNKRHCTVIQVVHPTPRDVFRFHLARVFVDDELKMPVRYESYDWPREPGGEPELIEEYTYLDLKLNNGFTDEDFSTRNPAYQFHQSTAVLGQSVDAR